MDIIALKKIGGSLYFKLPLSYRHKFDFEPGDLFRESVDEFLAGVVTPITTWRWYYLDNGDLIIIARSTYPQGRMVFRTELIRSRPQAGNG